MLVGGVGLMLVGGVIQATNWGDTLGSALLLAGFALFVIERLLTFAWPERDDPARGD